MAAVLLILRAAVVKRHWRALWGNEPSVSVGQPGHIPKLPEFQNTSYMFFSIAIMMLCTATDLCKR